MGTDQEIFVMDGWKMKWLVKIDIWILTNVTVFNWGNTHCCEQKIFILFQMTRAINIIFTSLMLIQSKCSQLTWFTCGKEEVVWGRDGSHLPPINSQGVPPPQPSTSQGTGEKKSVSSWKIINSLTIYSNKDWIY